MRISFKDFITNLRWIHIGIGVDISDPWLKNDVIKKLNESKIKYVENYTPHTNSYNFAIIGGKKKAINDFIDWWLNDVKDARFYRIHHGIFKRHEIYMLTTL